MTDPHGGGPDTTATDPRCGRCSEAIVDSEDRWSAEHGRVCDVCFHTVAAELEP